VSEPAGPKTVADLDDTIRASLRDYQRTRWVTGAGVIAVLCAAVVVLAVLYIQQGARLKASCEFWRTLAPLPVTVAQQTGKPSKLGVSIIDGSRAAYEGQGCGKPPPADPAFARWARYYHLPAG
jgi:hypothetical protein